MDDTELTLCLCLYVGERVYSRDASSLEWGLQDFAFGTRDQDIADALSYWITLLRQCSRHVKKSGCYMGSNVRDMYEQHILNECDAENLTTKKISPEQFLFPFGILAVFGLACLVLHFCPCHCDRGIIDFKASERIAQYGIARGSLKKPLCATLRLWALASSNRSKTETADAETGPSLLRRTKLEALSSKTATINLGGDGDETDGAAEDADVRLSLKCVAELVLPEDPRELPDFELTRDVYEETKDEDEASRLVAGLRFFRRRRITLAETLLAHYLKTNTSTWKLLRRLVKLVADLKEKQHLMHGRATPQPGRQLFSQCSVSPRPVASIKGDSNQVTLTVTDDEAERECKKQRVDLDNINVVLQKYEAELRKYFVQALLDEIYTDYTESSTTW